jgi:hypothetical protein
MEVRERNDLGHDRAAMPAGTHLLIGSIGHHTAGMADRGIDHARHPPECDLDAPKAARPAKSSLPRMSPAPSLPSRLLASSPDRSKRAPPIGNAGNRSDSMTKAHRAIDWHVKPAGWTLTILM